MAKRTNIVRLKGTWTPSLETANRLLDGSAMTIVAIGRISFTADIAFEGGDVDGFNDAHLAAANLLADLEQSGTVAESSISVTSRADPVPAFAVGGDIPD